ncbi:MAG: phage tail tape measure protein, partial [Candidatus Mariimomonas ferrooxydans]
MSVLGSLVIKIVGDNSAFNKTISQTQRQLNKSTRGLQTMARSMTTVGDIMVKGITLPLAIVGIASVKMAKDFEVSMRNVNSITKLSEKELQSLSKEVIALSTNEKMGAQSAKNLADGLYDISSSGFAGKEGLKVLEAAARGAGAGLTTTAVSAKGITAVLNAFGYSADKAGEIADTMFRTVDKGVITFEELSSTVGDWVGMGRAAGLEFNELSGAIAYMTTKGISAAESGTALQRMLIGIIKPSQEMAAVIAEAGFESGEMMLKTLGLTDTMKVLNDATGGSITKLIDLIPQIRGVRGANALLGAGYEELTDYMKDFTDTSGAMDSALEEQSKSLQYQFNILKNNATAIAIEIGNVIIPKLKDALGSITPKVKDLADKFGDLTPEMQDSILKWGLITAVLPLFISGIGRATTGIIKFRNALKLMNVASGGVLGPLGLIIAAVTALMVATGYGIDKLEQYDTAWSHIGSSVLGGLNPIKSATGAFGRVSAAIKEYEKGNISLTEAMFMAKKEGKELVAQQKEIENGAYYLVEAYQSAERFIKKSSTLPQPSLT